MKTGFSLLALALALPCPLLAQADPPVLTIPAGEYRLIPVCRLFGWEQGVVFPPPSISHSVARFRPDVQTFKIYELDFGIWAPSDPDWFPGEGAVALSNSVDAGLLFQARGTPTLPLKLVPGLNLVGCQSDLEARYGDIVGGAPDEGTVLYKYNPGPGRNFWPVAPPDYAAYTFANGAWSPEAPIVEVAEAVFIRQPPRISEARVSGGKITFEIGTPPNSTVSIQYRDSLASGSWQTLTNFAGNGATVTVTDNNVGTGVPQRFYRANVAQ